MKHHLPEQVPGFLAKLDDPYGITWRFLNIVRRFSPLRMLQFGLGYSRSIRYEKPVLIIGMPRSGTTMLFHLIRESSRLKSLPWEGHDVWRMYHHPRYSGWESDYVGRGKVGFGERRYINSFFYSYFGRGRFIEKTADNCMRTAYLLELFPDAIFIVIKRNPCDVINSLINGWRNPKGRFRSYYLPEDLNIQDYPHSRRWCFTLIEGWRNHVHSTIPEISFAQWERYVKAVETARSLVPSAQWVETHFEDLLSHPEKTMTVIYNAIQIENEPELETKLSELLANPINALTPPGQDKWRKQNSEEIKQLLPRVIPMAEKLGYRIDPSTGFCEIIR